MFKTTETDGLHIDWKRAVEELMVEPGPVTVKNGPNIDLNVVRERSERQ